MPNPLAELTGFPAAPPTAAVAVRPQESSAGAAAPQKAQRILIVDDDPQILDGVVMRLETAGYRTMVARDGFEAARLMLESPPQAIVLDIRLPRCDGMRFLDWIQQSNFGRSIPVVVLSTRLQDRRRALQAGARFFLGKPYDGHTLLDAIKRAIADLDSPPHEVVHDERCVPNVN